MSIRNRIKQLENAMKGNALAAFAAVERARHEIDRRRCDAMSRERPDLIDGLREAAVAEERGDPAWAEMLAAAERRIDEWESAWNRENGVSE